MNSLVVFMFFISAYFLDLSSAVLVWTYNKDSFNKNEQNLDIKYILQDGLSIPKLLHHSINGITIALLLVCSISLSHIFITGDNITLFNEVILGIGSLNMLGFGTNLYGLTKSMWECLG